MKRTFSINTATATTTIALHDGEAWIAEKRWPSHQDEAERLQPAVDALLREHQLSPDDIDQLLVCVGPGGFTSVRVGVSAANAWSFAKHIPIAAVSIFDLYEQADALVLVTANAKESWIMKPGEDPQWIDQEGFDEAGDFTFTGIVNEEWRSFLEEKGGMYRDQEEQLPDLSGLEFGQEIIKPWYYKDANITWSKKNLPSSS